MAPQAPRSGAFPFNSNNRGLFLFLNDHLLRLFIPVTPLHLFTMINLYATVSVGFSRILLPKLLRVLDDRHRPYDHRRLDGEGARGYIRAAIAQCVLFHFYQAMYSPRPAACLWTPFVALRSLPGRYALETKTRSYIWCVASPVGRIWAYTAV